MLLLYLLWQLSLMLLLSMLPTSELLMRLKLLIVSAVVTADVSYGISIDVNVMSLLILVFLSVLGFLSVLLLLSLLTLFRLSS